MRSNTPLPPTRKNKARPFVTAAFVLTLDGRIVGPEAALPLAVQQRRLAAIGARTDAFLFAGNTAADLAAAIDATGPAPVLRVVVSHHSRLPALHTLLETGGAPVAIYATSPLTRQPTAAAGHVSLHHIPGPPVDWQALLAHLRAQHGVRRLVCDGGLAVFSDLLAANLVDALQLTLCPVVLGGKNAPTLTSLFPPLKPPFSRWRLTGMEPAGGFCLVHYRRPR